MSGVFLGSEIPKTAIWRREYQSVELIPRRADFDKRTFQLSLRAEF